MTQVFEFGPLGFALEASVTLPALLEPFRARGGSASTVVRFACGDVEPTEKVVMRRTPRGRRLHGPGFAADVPGGANQLGVWESTAAAGAIETSILAALAAIVTFEAPRRGLVVLHAAGLRHDGGIVLVLAPSGTGKTTLARAAGDKAFCYNAALVDPESALAWPLPFTGNSDPALHDTTPGRVIACWLLARGNNAGLEWIEPARATALAMRSIVHIEDDPEAPLALAMAARFFARIPIRIARSAQPGDVLGVIDSTSDFGRLGR